MSSLLQNSDLKKVRKATRPFRYDLNRIPYDYIVEVRNRFKGLDLINSAWRTMNRGPWHCIRSSDQNHPQEKEMQKGKMAFWGGLINIWEKKRQERQRRKGKIYPFECRVPKNSKRDKKAFLSGQCKEMEENNRMQRLDISSRKLEIPREHFRQRWVR